MPEYLFPALTKITILKVYFYVFFVFKCLKNT